jgi:hypothetical protein
MTAFRMLIANAPIASRVDAEREAGGSAVVWAIIAMEFAFAAAGTPGFDYARPAGPLWIALCVTALAMAYVNERRRSVAWARAAMAAAVVMSAQALLSVLNGEAALIMAPVFLLAFAVQGLRGARALVQP